MDINKKPDKKEIAKIVSMLSRAESVEDVASALECSSRTLRRMFAKANMLPPAAYLPYTNTELTKNQKRRIRQLYSDFGGEFSKEEIAAELRVPIEKVTEYIKQEKLTHKILPLGENELNILDADKIKKSLEVREYKLKAKLESLTVAKLQESANKWENWHESFGKPFLSFLEKQIPKYKVEKLELQPIKPYAAVLSIQDFHFGRLASKLEVLEETNLEKQEEDVIKCVTDLLSKVAPFGTPEKLFLTIGGDFLNSDNSKLTTTHGTPQDSLPSHTKLTIKGSLLLVKIIDILRQFFPLIELVPTPGNHDNDTSVSLYLFVSAWFKDCDDVFTFFDMQEPNVRKRQYRLYGNTLLALMHGDGIHTKNLPNIVPSEARKLWGETTNTIIVTGHRHFRISQDLFGSQHVQVPTLAAEDRWGSDKGFQNKKGMNIVLIDKETGFLAEIVSNL